MFKDQLHDQFKIKELGNLHWLLGIEFKCDHVECMISFLQESYIEKILQHFSLQDAKASLSLWI